MQLERRQIVLRDLGVLVVAFLMWKVVLSGGGDTSTTVEPATVTTVANGQAEDEPRRHDCGRTVRNRLTVRHDSHRGARRRTGRGRCVPGSVRTGRLIAGAIRSA